MLRKAGAQGQNCPCYPRRIGTGKCLQRGQTLRSPNKIASTPNTRREQLLAKPVALPECRGMQQSERLVTNYIYLTFHIAVPRQVT